jgi:phosphate transport system permease protein
MSTQTLQLKPLKPWQPKLLTLIPDILAGIFTALSTMAIVAITPLKGRLGFSLVLIAMAIMTTATLDAVRRDRKAATNSVTTVLVFVAASFVLIPLLSLLWEIFSKGVTGLSWGIFTKDMSLTSSDAPLSEGGLLHALVGTLYLIFLASIVSTPLGILTALYIVEVKGRFAGVIRFFVQAMSGIPSIVAGLFIYAVWMIGLGNSYNAGAGAAALAILMIPTVSRTSEEVLKLIPNDLREAGLAMGATQWRTVSMVVIPAARSGLITAVILGIARIAGETAPLLLTIGGADALNLNPFSSNNSALPYYVWKNLLIGTETAISRAWLGVFVLIVFVFIFFTLARIFGSSRSSKG